MQHGREKVSFVRLRTEKHEQVFVIAVIGSWSEIPDKILYGNTFDFGNFDQCIEIRQETHHQVVQGQHCLFQFYSTSNETIQRDPKISLFNFGWRHLNERFGGAVCLPATCEPKCVGKILQLLFDGSDYEVAVDYNQADYCKVSQKTNYFSRSIVVAVCVISFLLICVVASTIYDLITAQSDERKRVELFLVFSIVRTGSNLLNFSDDSKNNIKSLHFIRCVSAVSILFLHIYVVTLQFPSTHNLKNDFRENAVILIGSSVNAFFVMSGLLATKSMIRDMKS